MTIVHRQAVRLCLALIVAGCAPAVRAPAPPEPRPLGRNLPRTSARPTEPSRDGSRAVEPSGRLTLRAALVAALTGNPRLAASSFEVRARDAEALQSGQRQNPELGAEVESFGGGGDLAGFDGSETTITLSQLLELGGKREKRRVVGEYERALAEWGYERARIDVLTDTAVAFYAVLAAQHYLELADELVGVADEALAAVSRRVRAGSTSPVEEGRARVELETSRIDRADAARALSAARTRLASTWGSTSAGFALVSGTLEAVPRIPALETLRSRVLESPGLARWNVERERRRAALALARTRRIPDVSVGAGVRHLREVDDTAFLVGFSVPLPLFDRNADGISAAELRLEQTETERSGAVVRAEADLAVAYGTLVATDAEVRALQDRAVPEAERTFAAARDAYLRGSMRFTDVLDTKRQLFELKRRYFAVLARLHTTVAEIERLTGTPIAETH